MSDYQTIIALIGNKDSSGLEVLYNAYGSRFYSYCINRWKLTEDEAWEVIYQTLQTLVLKIDNYYFENKGLFEGFLFKVLLNFIRQNFRSKRSKSIHELEFVDLNNEEELPSFFSKQVNKLAFAEYYSSEVVESPHLLALNEALLNLEETDKDILLLRAQNFSYNEIAELLGIDNNQLKVKHHRAKQKLVTFFNEIQSK